MNNKGFTLVELLMTIVLIALISVVAIPNINNIIDSNKKEEMLNDAKKLVSLAKNEVIKNYDIRNSDSYLFTINDLNKKGEILNDPDGGKYLNTSYVKYENTNHQPRYCIYLVGIKRIIGKNSCVYEKDLTLRNVVNRK